MGFISNVLQIAGVGLLPFLLLFLLQGSLLKYPLLFLYCFARLASNTAEVIVLHRAGTQSAFYKVLFWTDELVLDLLLFLMVIALIYKALEGKPQRSAAGKMLAGVVVAAIALPFFVISRLFTTHWFSGASQFLNFGGAIITLALWTALIGAGRRDPQLLGVSAGAGLMVTCAAIAYGVRQWMPSPGLVRLPDLFFNLTQVAGVGFWCWTFRPAARARTAPSDAVTSP